MNKRTSIQSKHSPSHVLDDHEISRPSSISVKAVGSIENFWWSYAVVRKVLLDYCLQVMWNAVFYDTVADYLSSWRKRKFWSDPKPDRNQYLSRPQSSVNEKIKSEAVSTVWLAYLRFLL